jgi:hypothetical protein
VKNFCFSLLLSILCLRIRQETPQTTAAKKKFTPSTPQKVQPPPKRVPPSSKNDVYICSRVGVSTADENRLYNEHTKSNVFC